MMIAILDTRPVLEVIASMAATVALWASTRAHATGSNDDPVADMTTRLRQPMRWSLTHPLRAVRRLTRSR